MIIISTYGREYNCVVEMFDGTLEEAKKIAEEMLNHLLKIDWAAIGINVCLTSKGFVKEEWIITPAMKEWIKLNKSSAADNWKDIRRTIKNK